MPLALNAWAEEIPPATDAPQPLAPEESRRQFSLPDDLRIELVASEPLVADPTAIAFDERGRLYVGELHGYNLEGYLDIVELNKTGTLDREVRRVQASPPAVAAAKQETYGTVKLLIDDNGDGRMDRASVWADRLPPMYGVVPARGGLIVTCPPDIIYLADRDGDGKAEVRETLFTGFDLVVMDRGINSPCWGLDNWIYVAWYARGEGEITGPRLPRPLRIAHTDFRFKPDGSTIEPVTGTSGTLGQTFDDFGDRFLSPHAMYAVPLPYHYLARNPFAAAPEGVANAADYNRVYPSSQPDPWRLARSKDPAWVKFYGKSETTPQGYFTAACGQMIYRADDLPESYHGNLFCCEPAGNLVHRGTVEREEAGFRVRRAPGEEQSEFLTSTDSWFRPVNLATGPDGAIYLVDMYREIIEDYSAIPRFLQQQYVESLIKGHDRGRIWRIVAKDAGKPVGVDFAGASEEKLVDELSAGNAWRRETAQRLLTERGDKAAKEPLRALVRNGRTPQARLHALYTLDGLEALRPADVEQALDDGSPGVRLHALRLADPWLPRSGPLLNKVVAMTADTDPQVRLQLALSLGQSNDPRALAALAQLAAEHGQERWMPVAVISSAALTADELLQLSLRAADDAKPSPGEAALLQGLASTIGARHNDAQVARLLTTIADLKSQDGSALEVTLLDGLLDGLARGKSATLEAEAGHQALERLFASPSAPVRERTLRVAGLVKLAESPTMRKAWSAAALAALDPQRALADRLAALRMLNSAPWGLRSASQALIDPRRPPELQLAAVDTLASGDDPKVADDLLANWGTLSPKVQERILDVLFARRSRLPGLLDAIEHKTVAPASLTSLRRAQLLDDSNPEIRRRAHAILSKADDDRSAVLKGYQAALTLPRDVDRGRAVFEKHCTACHRLNEKGFEVGPDLAGVRVRPDATLLADVLDPSGAIASGFTLYTVATQDGRVFSGVLAAETATSVTLRREKGQTDTILRENIDEMRASARSLMPDGLEKELSPQDLANLFAFLRESLGAVEPSGIVLFDDEPEFVDALNEGEEKGAASLSTVDPFSGGASLRVAFVPRQAQRLPGRQAARRPGWSYHIREKPQPGEFRYLRFAWKSEAGIGVMLELAADGAWPPADKPLRRYVSGKNTSRWPATEISPDVPKTWTAVTVDLWKDCGDFTLTGMAPNALDDSALIDRIELLRVLE